MSKKKLVIFILGLISIQLAGQTEPTVMDYAKPQEYVIDSIRVTGINFLN